MSKHLMDSLFVGAVLLIAVICAIYAARITAFLIGKRVWSSALVSGFGTVAIIAIAAMVGCLLGGQLNWWSV